MERELKRFPVKAQQVFGRAVMLAGSALRDNTKKLRPVSAKTTGYGVKGIPVDTGRLRQSILSRRLSLLAAGVIAPVKYASAVHQGTRKMPARPFFAWSLQLGGQKKIDAVFEKASKLLP